MGGIPRFLFKAPSKLPRAGAVDDAISGFVDRQTFALNDVAQNGTRIDAGSLSSEFTDLWSLYHLVPDEFHTSYSIQLACDNAMSLLRQRLMEKSAKELWELFSQTDERQGTLRGIRYEAYAHKKISVDGINLKANATKCPLPFIGLRKKMP